MTAELPPTYGNEIIKKFFGDEHLPENAHAGLVFDRYLRILERGADYRKIKNIANELRQFVREFNERREQKSLSVSLLDDINNRMNRPQPLLLKHKRYRVHWRLVTGLGAYHPIENGFCFDPIVGVPTIAATGIKGLCRYAARLQELSDETIETLFGPEILPDENRQSKQGDLYFLDAYPAEWPRLEVDVVNCHHLNYYGADIQRLSGQGGKSQNADIQPVDWDDPVPVFFLTVAKETKFIFRIGSLTNKEENLNKGFELLHEGLTNLGLGAKTSVGYGIMKECSGGFE